MALQLASAQHQDIKFDCLTLEDGLSQTTVLSILQDRTGFLWFGTIDGLNRFDGYTFTIYSNNPADPHSLSDDWITSMYIDKRGTLWTGTLREGLNRYNFETDDFKHYKPDIPLVDAPVFRRTLTTLPSIFTFFNSNTIKAICEDHNGTLWIGTFGNGIFNFDSKQEQFARFVIGDSSAYSLAQNIMVICETSRGDHHDLWFGTFGGGLIRYNEQAGFRYYTHNPADSNSLCDNRITTIYADTEVGREILWIGTLGGGLQKLDIESGKITHFMHQSAGSSGLSDNNILSILKDKSGIYWIGTLNGGLNKFNLNGSQFSLYLHDPFNPNSLGSNEVLSLFQDKSGIIWVGTNLGDGINKFDSGKKKFTRFFHDPSNPNGLSDNVIFSIYEDRAGILWIGTYQGGLNRFDRFKNEYRHYRYNPADAGSLSDDHVRSIFEDSRGNLWIGTFNGGLNCLDRNTGKFEHFVHNPSDSTTLSANQVRAIHEDSHGNLWIGTFGGGLNKFNRQSGTFTHYRHDPSDSTSLSDDRIYSILQDSSGTLWITTFNGGLNKFDREAGIFTANQHDPFNVNSLSDNRVFTICPDPGDLDVIWLGTSGGGLNRFDIRNNRFTRYTQQNGLPNNVVYGILPDESGNLWISTNKGISKFQPKTDTFTNYDLTDGLQSDEFNAGAYFKSKSGEMFFGGIKGFNCFYPDKIQINTHIPQVVITSFKIHDTEMKHLIHANSVLPKIELGYDENYISFEFSALDYTKLGKNQFAYKLEGLNNDWLLCSTRRFANYTNLDPGEYTFQVKGSNSDGVWNNEGAFVKFRIKPPYWSTWWFYLLTTIIVSLGAVLFYRYRLKENIKRSLEIERIRMAENERVRKTLAADFHDELGQKLTRISLFSEILKRKLGKALLDADQYIDKIIEVSKELSQSTRDFIWTLDPDQDTLHDAMIYLKDFGDDMFDKTGIEFRVSGISNELKQVRLPVEWRRHLTLIFKEAMNNVLKHADCKKVAFKIEFAHKQLMISLTDDGVGYDHGKISEGKGIHNMKHRAKAIGSQITFSSENGQGTIICFSGEMPQTGY
ncbi:histidine kinase [candidate division KSB1 bacterium]|nr:histidine kinase [candidate division KSB1 bacterium]